MELSQKTGRTYCVKLTGQSRNIIVQWGIDEEKQNITTIFCICHNTVSGATNILKAKQKIQVLNFLMAAPDRLRESSRLQGVQRRGWSAWTRAMVPPDSNGTNLEPRGPGQVGFMS